MSLTRRRMILSLGAAAAAAAASTPVGTTLEPETRCIPGSRHSGDVEAFLGAVMAGDLGEVRRHLAGDATLAAARDVEGRSAFLIANLSGRRAVADELRERIELDVVEAAIAEQWERFDELVARRPELCNAAHPIGGTPLYGAALAGIPDLYRLRGAGCLPDHVPDSGSGFTAARGALMCPRLSGARVCATDLLSNGANVNAPQRGGDSVLHGAVRRRSDLLVRLAIRKGADVTATDGEGRTALALAEHLAWEAGVDLLTAHAQLPRDHRASRFLMDANRQPIVRPDLTDVPQDLQNAVTGCSHGQLDRLRTLVAEDPRLVYALSTDDELAIEACAHTGNQDIIRFHLDHGAPLSLPTAVSLGDAEAIRFLLDRDPRLIHERGAHDFPVMWYVALGTGRAEIAELLHGHGVEPDQESVGTTALHWCALRDRRELAAWLIAHGSDVEALAFSWSSDGQTPLQIARSQRNEAIASLLVQAGAKR